MVINQQQLLQMLPNAGQYAGVFVSALNAAMAKFAISTPARVAAFIAQVGHESANLSQLVENLNYSAQGLASTWPRRFATNPSATPPQPNVLALSIARNPEAIGNSVYANRLGNGALETGDGWRYRGRGLIQLTGRTNYLRCGQAIGIDLLAKPESLEQPGPAAMAAGWFWSDNGLGALADTGSFTQITQRVNGGQIGAADRLAIYQRSLKVLV